MKAMWPGALLAAVVGQQQYCPCVLGRSCDVVLQLLLITAHNICLRMLFQTLSFVLQLQQHGHAFIAAKCSHRLHSTCSPVNPHQPVEASLKMP
jgi:hypothetical protein